MGQVCCAYSLDMKKLWGGAYSITAINPRPLCLLCAAIMTAGCSADRMEVEVVDAFV